ncbi:MAG: glutamate 5-kinase [Planctomycetes bacterium]|jgi:glutamate 5-kinase|nr:glutamate 5-kinase [Planctomycetota bacterium]
MHVRENILKDAERIVVKVGTSAMTDETGRLDEHVIRDLSAQIAELRGQGRQITLVASGAVGAGMGELDLPARPKTLPMLQAVAAVGQSQLMRTFHDILATHGIRVAQVLLTREDFEDRRRYLNIRNTLTTLLDADVLPILNENDAVGTEELSFGDNDIIAAHMTNLLAADVLVLLTTTEGVLAEGKLLDVIEQVDEDTLTLALADKSRLGSGGMATKLTAAGYVTRAGEAAVIANARAESVLTRLVAGETVGTVFVPAEQKLSSRRRWIGQAARPRGTLAVDAGAAAALVDRGKSLLPSGIVRVEGTFTQGDTVAIVDPQGREIARGLTNYASDDLASIIGKRSDEIAGVLGDKPYDEAIHRDNLTVTQLP